MRLLVSLTAAAVLLAAPTTADAETRQARLLHVNDVYEITPDRDGLGGFGPLARLIAEREPALVTFGGDLISPSVLSSLTRGAHMVSLMNAVGTDAAVVGNHEFDFGPDVFAERLGESAFPWLAANMTGVAGVKGREILVVGGLKVGLFGVVTPETATLSSPGAGIGFSDPLASAKEQAAALRAEGAEVVVALTHLTLEEDLAVGRIGGIDVVLGGHDHEPWAHHDGDTLILKAGYNARFLAVVDLTVETGGKQPVVTAGWSMVPVTGPADPAVAAKVAAFQQELDGALAAPLATLAAELDSRRSTVRGRE
ncbi:MAG: metallophosphoesterase, partial [Caenispirillum bisanense]|nr:metallophosphoesterase [Caenispirillum bisanense]